MPSEIVKKVTESFHRSEEPAQESGSDQLIVDRSDQALDYMVALRSCRRDYTVAQSRAVLITFTLMVVFALVHLSVVSEVRFAGLLMKDISSLMVFVPPFVSYLLLDAFVSEIRIWQITQAHGAAFTIWNKEASARDLDVLIAPRIPMYWPGPTGADVKQYSPADRLLDVIGTVVGVIVVLVYLGFQIYAFVILFRDAHLSLILTVVSLVISLILSIGAALVFWAVD